MANTKKKSTAANIDTWARLNRIEKNHEMSWVKQLYHRHGPAAKAMLQCLAYATESNLDIGTITRGRAPACDRPGAAVRAAGPGACQPDPLRAGRRRAARQI